MSATCRTTRRKIVCATLSANTEPLWIVMWRRTVTAANLVVRLRRTRAEKWTAASWGPEETEIYVKRTSGICRPRPKMRPLAPEKQEVGLVSREDACVPAFLKLSSVPFAWASGTGGDWPRRFRVRDSGKQGCRRCGHPEHGQSGI
eukprot:scaffold1237_cov243-Pinguiococcus_pyrenoidosus.AAC.42